MASIQRRKAVTVNIGGVRVGSDAPVVVQSMTNTDTADVSSTVQQVAALARAGSELVRVTVNNDAAAKGVPHIVEQLDKQGINVPIIGDFHYNGHQLLKKYPDCAKALAKYRINPGNVSIGKKDDDNFKTMVTTAATEPDAAKRKVLYSQINDFLLDVAYIHVISAYSNIMAMGANVHGLRFEPSTFVTIREMWLA